MASMQGKTLGAYRIVSELGSGGMGTVYLATVEGEPACAPHGDQVAVKVIHPHLLARPGVFKRFLREGEIGRQVAHENVVRTLDVDARDVEGDTVHFLVMEYVAGRTLRDLLDDLGRVPEALLRELARQASAGIAAIHEAGVIHRDLKPENILVTKDHRVRVMDLGIARLVEQSVALTRDGQFAGSLYYAAPEQFGSAEIGPAVDLYSLGVLLYELATGENPFRRDLATAVMAAHLKLVPKLLNLTDPDVSEFFAEVVHSLLAKNPGDRIESASFLRQLLEEEERSEWWCCRERLRLEEQAHLPRVHVRRETETYGRDIQMESLRDAWRAADAGRGCTVLLEGEAGIGKTRLLDDFLREFEGGEARILYGSYPPSGGVGGLSDALLDHFGAAGLSDALTRYLTVTPRLVPAFAAFVRQGVPPAGSDSMPGDALHAVMVQLMRGMAEEKPLLWVVDDLQFAERENRQLVLSMARALRGYRVLLIAATRPGIPEDEIAQFSRLSNFRRLSPGRLGARDVVQLLREAFGSEVLADRLGAKIAYKSDGVPLFVFEMIRGLREGRFITELPDGSFVETRVIEEIEVPSAVRDLIEGRLGDLSVAERSLLSVGAIQGFEFDADLLARVLERKRIVVLQTLAEIERRTGVIRSGGGRCRFDHHQIQEVIYQGLMDELRAEYHALIAEAMVDREGGTGELPDATAHLVAWHHLHGSRPASAVDHLSPALDHLKQAYRNEAAVALIDRALESPVLLAGAERVEILLRQAGHLAILGLPEAEGAALDEAARIAAELDLPAWIARVRATLGGHLRRRGLYDMARETLDRAVAGAREAGELRIEADAEGKLGSTAKSMGRYEKAQEHYERSLELSLRLGDRQGESYAYGGLGAVLSALGRYEEAREQHERWLALARESRDLKSEAYALMNLGIVMWFQGRYDEAIELEERVLLLSREIGDRRGEAAAMGNLGISIQSQGRYEEARENHEKLLTITREIGDLGAEAVCHGCLGGDFRQLGLYEVAHEHFERQLALSREIGDRLGEGVCRLNLGSLLGRLGDREAARESVEKARGILAEIGARREEGYCIHTLGHLAMHAGNTARASAHFEEALAVRREIDYPAGIAETLAVSGLLAAGSGRLAEAESCLEEALGHARRLVLPTVIVLAEAALAKLPGAESDAALPAFTEHEAKLNYETRMEVMFMLWEAGRDPAHLEEGHRLLCHLRDHAPKKYRETMIENVPLHRDIMAANEEQRSGA